MAPRKAGVGVESPCDRRGGLRPYAPRSLFVLGEPLNAIALRFCGGECFPLAGREGAPRSSRLRAPVGRGPGAQGHPARVVSIITQRGKCREGLMASLKRACARMQEVGRAVRRSVPDGSSQREVHLTLPSVISTEGMRKGREKGPDPTADPAIAARIPRLNNSTGERTAWWVFVRIPGRRNRLSG